MDRKLKRLIAPCLIRYIVLAALFAAATFFFKPALAAAELAVLAVAAVLEKALSRHRGTQALRLLTRMSEELGTASKEMLLNSPFPMVIFRTNTEEIIWSNDAFLDLTGRKNPLLDSKISDAVPEFAFDWLLEGKKAAPAEFAVEDRRYTVFGTITDAGGKDGGELATTYWIDVTELSNICERYYASRPVVAIIMVDNFEELMRNVPENGRSNLRAGIEQELVTWTSPSGGMLIRYDRDRYLFVFESRYLEQYQKEKFSVINTIHKVVSPNGTASSLSIGVGRDAGMGEMFQSASQSIEMALGRGGDQAVVKNRFDFSFYGGRSREQERRTKVKSRVTALALSELISASPVVYIMGHRFADLDAVGAAAGIAAVCRRLGVEARIVVERGEVPGSIMVRELCKAPEYERVFVSEEDALLDHLEDALLVVVDTNRPSQVASGALLQSCGKAAVIDHHRRAADFIDSALLNYQEPYASSASELVTELIQYAMEPSDLLRVEAEALLAGIVLDTKNFTLRTGGRTFDAAAFLRRCGADTVEVKRLFQTNLSDTIMKYQVLEEAQFFHEGVAVAAVEQPVGRIIAAQAADEMLNIEGVEAAFVLYLSQGLVNISGRSTGNVNVQVILEDLGGGGNAAAAGAQIPAARLSVAVDRLQAAIEKYFSDSGDG